MNTELNERVAVEVMGYQFSTPPGMVSQKWWRKLPDGYVDVCFDALPDYSEYMQYAWLVVEELMKLDMEISLGYEPAFGWYCKFQKGFIVGRAFDKTNICSAICHAGLDICEKLRRK